MSSLDRIEAKRQALQIAISEGFESGIAENFDMVALQRELDEEAGSFQVQAFDAQKKT
ncbi:hypothetical protein [Denitrobaculum tricleocarpae]|uniref:hypothetical protein n=1 Tax=Denitrobaculum tricleocarpae TaxID=2591009 RepID=UPI0015D2D05F|nr:hypothetical protein [Denitrobaculum tricleocarpae]